MIFQEVLFVIAGSLVLDKDPILDRDPPPEADHSGTDI